MWRCGGQLGNTSLSYVVKYPVLLPKDHPLAVLVIKRAHERVLHNGTKETLTELRYKYWIPRRRSTVKKVLHNRLICRRIDGQPYKTPAPPPLPECCVKEAPAFSYTGVDFAGPLNIRVTKSFKTIKVWTALFTCYVTRAIHLDVVPDQSTSVYIRCLKRKLLRQQPST